MTSCHIYGCRNLETRCKDCGRLVNTAHYDSQWISVSQQEPPKDKPFLASTEWGIEMMSWKVKEERHGFYSYYTPCSCCTGYCSDDFDHWMPLPQPPEPLSRRQENDREGFQGDNQVDR